MIQKGYLETAHFIILVHNWFRACDERGIDADLRVRYLFEMHKFLTKNIDFHTFPSKVCGHYVHGMPVQTFEAILQNISTCIYLYSLAKDGMYNT